VNELQPYQNKMPKNKEWIITNNNTLVPIVILEEEPELKFGKEQLMQILRKENEIRKSEEVQVVYSSLYEDQIDPVEFDRKIIKDSLRSFGYDPDNDESLQAYQISCGLNLEDDEVKQCVVWMKYDFLKVCPFEVGDNFVDCPVMTLDKERKMITDFMTDDKPFILLGGSYT